MNHRLLKLGFALTAALQWLFAFALGLVAAWMVVLVVNISDGQGNGRLTPMLLVLMFTTMASVSAYLAVRLIRAARSIADEPQRVRSGVLLVAAAWGAMIIDYLIIMFIGARLY